MHMKAYDYISIHEVLSRLFIHPMLKEITKEQAVYYTLDFLSLMGVPQMFQKKEAILKIEDYRAVLPCDLVDINMVKDCKTNICLRSMTSEFMPKNGYNKNRNSFNLTYKTQGKVIYTSFKEGNVLLSYTSIPVDEEGFPMLINNQVFIKALEAYIKAQYFSILFDLGKINEKVLQHTEQEYAWLAGQCRAEFSIPDVNEMESIKNMWCSFIQNNNEFYDGFKNLGSLEYIKKH